ncbi:hypothetical protein GC169_02625 [bacterium]|nr:hypothetical protein [bacterium]
MPADAPPVLNVKPRTLAMIVGGGLLAGATIVVGAIMPAEYNVDLLGIGKATGIARLWAPDSVEYAGAAAPALAFAATAPKSVTRIDIPLGAASWDEAALEYKVAMTAGQSILYSWEAVTLDGAPLDAPVEVDQHGHDVVEQGQSETVIEFRKFRSIADQGSMTAPFDGIFGWYFRNHSDEPAMIRLTVEGFYDLVPPGEPGNEFRIRPVDQPVDQPAAPAGGAP